MFTGIIEEVGKVANIKQSGDFAVLTINACKVLKDVHLGDSIAVNGVCLTVTSFNSIQFTADVMAETLRRTSLAQLHVASPVNLERAMPMNGRFGGHIVSGHIDGTGEIIQITPANHSTWYRVKTSLKLMRYIVEKGSITIDGISLTVVDTDQGSFRVSIIPHTINQTNLATKTLGSIVNLENDIVGKYIEQFVMKRTSTPSKNAITAEFLEKVGF
ncbi:riboflavin synthase [[Haemophilus] ducreyi]|uniref:riboflavin synthase n=1 Tax=Haemophilus ducreyi TaxID=730 RepID=UPI000655CEAC|nr:riboflavin synthase [[Haemophilus] ducreyi]AKO45446.1 riboflavin synthase subunit alpha [[Haemophilus] ducreyi]AKO46833.1 riboflavin synthase subunit alpha [[Haemophilus] ducreyi]AKO48172.1 riboflavin synthase subunit alpha [[Haemophilus] ducreyi]AKO49563.1 riboflavin synthase subunit alpha [[Haemophilus] ducreyi]OOS04748.1 riboflavin synthase [[Haemophilus] ducreyi]